MKKTLLVSELPRSVFKKIFDINHRQLPWHVNHFKVFASTGKFVIDSYVDIDLSIGNFHIFKHFSHNDGGLTVSLNFFNNEIAKLYPDHIIKDVSWNFGSIPGWTIEFQDTK